MKIQCDVCHKEEASVFCTADEAALCQTCDDRVHNANKLASKHPRFSLVRPQFQESLRCDICQKRRALLFCQEDRALLCRECDIQKHKINEHTKRHNRFLLSGVKISAPAAPFYQATASSSGSQSETEMIYQSNFHPNSTAKVSESSSSFSQQDSVSTSIISEYLVETLPDWHVDDFLDPSSHYGFCKITSEVGGTFGSFFSQRCAQNFKIKNQLVCDRNNVKTCRRKWWKDASVVPQICYMYLLDRVDRCDYKIFLSSIHLNKRCFVT